VAMAVQRSESVGVWVMVMTSEREEERDSLNEVWRFLLMTVEIPGMGMLQRTVIDIGCGKRRGIGWNGMGDGEMFGLGVGSCWVGGTG